ncbi:MAG TPA: hypothetical protein ACHBZ9_10565 [Arsenophonus nasoniae]|uniref:hypothetical protein n=1 Tax=Arsenophonus nasoniae TaxID=638 RepID=UPI003879689C
MFEFINNSDFFNYAFEKIFIAIGSNGQGQVYAATSIGLKNIRNKYKEFRAELDEKGYLDEWIKYDLDTYDHAISALMEYFLSNPSNLTKRDAIIYASYLRANHQGFYQLANQLKNKSS